MSLLCDASSNSLSDGPLSFADHEPALWRAVITQALMDAASQSKKPEAKRIREDAKSWLMGMDTDFETVCEHAGMDPHYVRQKAHEALKNGCVWRLPAGQGWRSLAKKAAAHAAAEAARASNAEEE